ncbi:MAG: dimethyl sulfoxide reductase anchor subunit [Planctomycetales bacterium]|nr:dimethyl sulfoxide reductase anchor subunit [Planctomycetales bacterium]MCA9168350.1 dimethyl sulfoxide reductase anchor subunit [Planctomycetales bacterium]
MHLTESPSTRQQTGPADQAVSPTSFTLEMARQQQRELTAVEQFAAVHGKSESASNLYRDLIPAVKPQTGEQYAFEVNLDKCTGCKACVAACHHLNGLEADETWRRVGLLVGTKPELPVLQHVTTACHHCVEPGCLQGCPTNAYEKDPETGIVIHLDDQCFGCQYCILACPYEVPRFSASKGIVRKCDMCVTRLSSGEAPACVQSCPSQAIRITNVTRSELAAAASADRFLPDSPSPKITTPATRYVGRIADSMQVARVDKKQVARQHVPLSLVCMLVLTQMSVGCITAATLDRSLSIASATTHWSLLLAAVATGLLGIGAATFHLGRPHLAHRAILGWRHSWLSREAIVFGAYLPCLLLSVGTFAWPRLTPFQTSALALSTLTGWLGVFCSMRIYQFTQRPNWVGWRTTIPFLTTAITLGGSTWLASSVGSTSVSLPFAVALVAGLYLARVAGGILVSRHTHGPSPTPSPAFVQLRSSSHVCGATLITGALLLSAYATDWSTALAIAGCGGLLLAELLDRMIYFETGAAIGMPGGLGE